VTVAIVADERIGSVSLTSFFRLQGTVFGSLTGYIVMVLCRVRACVAVVCVCGIRHQASLCALWQTSATAIACLLSVWCFVCSYVRTVPRYVYAANVASFSCAIIVYAARYATRSSLNSCRSVLPLPFGQATSACRSLSTDGAVEALSRIQQTIIGIVVYVVVANSLWPQRASDMVRRLLHPRCGDPRPASV
jgi:hypothetical protein